MPSAASHLSQQSDSCLGKTKNMKDERKPTDLFLAISHAAVRRQQEGIQQRKEQQGLDHEREEEHVLKPQRVQEEEEAEAEAEAKVKMLITEMFEEELKAWRKQRDKDSARDRLSRAEVDEKVLRMVEEVHRLVGMDKRRMEDGTEEPHEVWRCRMVDLRYQIYQVWNENEGRILMGLPKYVEGYPVREGIDPPKFMPGKMQKMSGLGVCLQCEVKALACSMSVQARGSGKELKSKGCKRCEAEGDRCIIECELELVEEGQGEAKEKKQTSHIWDWWNGSPEREPDTDPVAEAVEMWERRRRGAKLELVGGCMLWVEARGFAPRRSDKDD